MNKVEHILTCLAEECGEVAKEVHKSLRFGLDDKLTTNPDGPRGSDGPTNREKLAQELNDLMGVVSMLVEEGVLPDNWSSPKLHQNKAVKVKQYMRYAERVGALKF